MLSPRILPSLWTWFFLQEAFCSPSPTFGPQQAPLPRQLKIWCDSRPSGLSGEHFLCPWRAPCALLPSGRWDRVAQRIKDQDVEGGF